MSTIESHAAGWSLAAELGRWLQLRTVEYHPGGGQNDCLRLTTAGPFLHGEGDSVAFAFDVNLGGSIHLVESPDDERRSPIPHETWVGAYREAALPDFARHVLQSAGFDPPRLVPTYPEGVTVQVAAAILRICANDPSDWEIRSVWRDDEEGLNLWEAYNSPFPEMAPISKSAWVVLRDNRPQAWLALGWLWTRYGERRDLMAERSRGRPIDDLARVATRPRPAAPMAAPIFTT
jgi:hypothetical protein